jgi:hypothetical protein
MRGRALARKLVDMDSLIIISIVVQLSPGTPGIVVGVGLL